MPLAHLGTETRDVNTYVHIWTHEDAADRARRRATMRADPRWIALLERSAKTGYLAREENG